jgi:hypothetical protein
MGPAGPAYWRAVVAVASQFGALSFFMIVAQCRTMGSGSDHEENGLGLLHTRRVASGRHRRLGGARRLRLVFAPALE